MMAKGQRGEEHDEGDQEKQADERGDQVFSELRGEGTGTHNKIFGTFLGGTGRYSGAVGQYEFSWRFVLEAEDGTVQGESIGLLCEVQ